LPSIEVKENEWAVVMGRGSFLAVLRS